LSGLMETVHVYFEHRANWAARDFAHVPDLESAVRRMSAQSVEVKTLLVKYQTFLSNGIRDLRVSVPQAHKCWFEVLFPSARSTALCRRWQLRQSRLRPSLRRPLPRRPSRPGFLVPTCRLRHFRASTLRSRTRRLLCRRLRSRRLRRPRLSTSSSALTRRRLVTPSSLSVKSCVSSCYPPGREAVLGLWANL